MHVLNPETGEPMAMLSPPHNLSADGQSGALTGLCVSGKGLFVASDSGPTGRIVCLPKAEPRSHPLDKAKVV